MTALASLSALVLLACSPPEEQKPEGGDSGPTDDEPELPQTPADFEDPQYSADEAGQLIADTLALGIPSPFILAEHFALVILGYGTEECPGLPDGEDWKNIGLSDAAAGAGCTTEEGALFAGIGWYDETRTDGETGAATEYKIGGDFLIRYPDGQEFGGGGETLYDAERNDLGGYDFTSDYLGTWVDDTREDWLGHGISGALMVTGENGDGNWMVHFNGGLAVGEVQLHYDDVAWDSDGDCPGVATGTIGIRDDLGYWYEWRLGDDCDHCGSIYLQGEDLGEFCHDLDAWGQEAYASFAPH